MHQSPGNPRYWRIYTPVIRDSTQKCTDLKEHSIDVTSLPRFNTKNGQNMCFSVVIFSAYYVKVRSILVVHVHYIVVQ